MAPSNLRIRRARRAAWLGLGIAMAATACSSTLLAPDACTDTTQCRQAFGWGSTCGSDGFCSAVQTHPRCDRSFPLDLMTAPERYRDAVVFGALFSYTEHLGTLQAAELAVRIANRSGASPYTFGLVTCDTDATGGVDDLGATQQAAEYLVDVLQVPAIIGPRGSSRTEAAWAVAQDSDTLIISPSATSPTLTGLEPEDPSDEMPGRLWRTVPPDTLQSIVIASDLRARGVTDISIVHEAGSYGDSLSALLAEQFVMRGGNAPNLERYTSSLADAVASVSDDDVQEIVLISAEIADYVDFLNLATSNGASAAAFDQRGLFFSDGAFNQRLYSDPQASAEVLFDNIRGSRPAPASGELFNAFTFEYFDEFQESPDALAFTAHSYDAAWLALYGAIWSDASEGEVSGTGIAKGLRQISDGPEVKIQSSSWEGVIETFGALESMNVRGASGTLDYDPETEETTAPIELWFLVDTNGWGFGSDGLVDP